MSEWAVGTPADQQWLRAASKVLSPFYNGPEDAGYIYQCTGLIKSSEQKTSGKKMDLYVRYLQVQFIPTVTLN